MSRYIDADVLIDDLIHNRSFYPALVASAIKNTPTADVVEVVRCKDCKRYTEPYCEVVRYARMPNDFCSFGERRANDAT